MTILTTVDVTKKYGEAVALSGVSVSVEAGEIVAVTGPSGSGKSTLMHCLAGIVPPDGGFVTYAGQGIHDWTEAHRSKLRRTDFGVMFQFGQLIPELSAADNVALPLLLGGLRRHRALGHAQKMLEKLGVGQLARSFPTKMSGGEQQRVALARAMVTAPKVLFADEPTGALDSLSGEQVMAAIVHLSRSSQTTVVIVTHEAKVAAYADREIVLRDGKLDPSGLGLRPVTR
jgi:putative ABC transport system ATP-binding protein